MHFSQSATSNLILSDIIGQIIFFSILEVQQDSNRPTGKREKSKKHMGISSHLQQEALNTCFHRVKNMLDGLQMVHSFSDDLLLSKLKEELKTHELEQASLNTFLHLVNLKDDMTSSSNDRFHSNNQNDTMSSNGRKRGLSHFEVGGKKTKVTEETPYGTPPKSGMDIHHYLEPQNTKASYKDALLSPSTTCLPSRNKDAFRSAKTDLNRIVCSAANGVKNNIGNAIVRICTILDVTATETVLKSVEDVVEMLVVMKKRHTITPTSHKMNHHLDRVLDVLQLLPPMMLQAAHGLLKTAKQCAALDELSEVVVEKVNVFEAPKNSDVLVSPSKTHLARLSKNEIEKLPREAIGKLTASCAAHANRFPEFEQACTKLGRQATQIKEWCGKLQLELEGSRNVCLEELRSAETSLVQRKKAQAETLKVIAKRMQKIKTEMKEKRPDLTEEELQAMVCMKYYIGQEKSVHQTFSAGEQNVNRQKDYVDACQERLQYLDRLLVLCTAVITFRKEALQSERLKLEDERRLQENHSKAQILKFVPSLCRSVVSFNMVQTRKRRMAKEYVSQIQNELEQHREVFHGEAHMDRDNIQKRLSQYTEIVLASKNAVVVLGQGQIDHWKTALPKLPSLLQKDVMRMLTELFESLEGPLRTVLGQFINANQEPNTPTPPRPWPITSKSTDPSTAVSSKNIYQVHDQITTKFIVGGKAKMIAGKIVQRHENGTYTVHYDDGDLKHNMNACYLLNDQEVATMKAKAEAKAEEVMDEEEEEEDSSNCNIM